MRLFVILAAAVLLIGNVAHAQIGNLLWEENFNDLDNWIKETGNGSWGWGNGELQYYSENNVDIAAVPGEVGNTALRITAKQESGPGIVDQWGNPLSYTSGKVISKSKVSLQYGMIETRVRVPDLDLGGWPAVWLLGTTNWDWPRKGEIDMMELGSTQAFRDLHDDAQRWQRTEQLHRQPGRRRQRHLLYRRRSHAAESIRRGQPLVGSG